MKLYYSPGACSMAVHVVLAELGLEHDHHEVNIKAGDNRKPEFLKVNPRGQVGALETDEGVITENAAIIIYLNDKNKGKLIPQDGFERAKALQWLMYANSTLHGAYSKVMFLKKNGGSDELIQKAADAVQAQWDEVERHLTEAGTTYLAGNEITAGDIYTTVVANWDFLPQMPNFGPKTRELLKNVSQRPAYQQVAAKENVEYKAAA